jgi:hypothetical protein
MSLLFHTTEPDRRVEDAYKMNSGNLKKREIKVYDDGSKYSGVIGQICNIRAF